MHIRRHLLLISPLLVYSFVQGFPILESFKRVWSVQTKAFHEDSLTLLPKICFLTISTTIEGQQLYGYSAGQNTAHWNFLFTEIF